MRHDDRMDDLDHLVDRERQGWDALASGQAGPYYREHPTHDALMTLPFGVLTRDLTIDAMESAPPWSTYDMQDPRRSP